MSDMTQRKYLLSLFLILIRAFIEFFNLLGNSLYVLPDNGTQTEILTYSPFTDSVTKPDFSLINPIIYSVKNFLKRFIKTIFIRVNYCFRNRIKINRSKLYSFSLCFPNKTFIVIWYLRPSISSNKSLNKSLMFDLLASNWAKGSFEFIISIL